MPHNLQVAPWNLKDLLICLTISTLLAAATTFAAIKFFPSLQHVSESRLLLISFIAQWLIFLGPILLLTKKKYQLKADNFGLHPMPLGQIIKKALLAYLSYILLAGLIVSLKEKFNLPIPGFGEQVLFDDFEDIKQSALTNLLIISFIAPILEEIFFRGFILRTLLKKIPKIPASLLAAAFFSILHFPWQSFGQIFILGLILNHLTIKNYTLAPAIAFHILNNTIAFAILLNL